MPVELRSANDYNPVEQRALAAAGEVDVSVTVEQTTAWCQKLVEKTPDFPLLEACLDVIPELSSLSDLPEGTRVLIRGDTDVVVADDGTIEEDVRLRSLWETLKFCFDKRWVPIVYGHRGRDPQLSLAPVAEYLKTMMIEGGLVPTDFCFIEDWMDDVTGQIHPAAGATVRRLAAKSLVVLENTRKYSLEQALWKIKPADVPQVAEKLKNYANGMREQFAAVHINEGFAASNRDLSSTVVPLTMDRVALGAYIDRELREHTTKTRQSELVIFSGMKINKLDDLEQILQRGQVRIVIAAGSLAMSLKKADAELRGETFSVGLAEDPSQKIYIPPERREQSKRMLQHGQKNDVRFVLPADFILGDGTASETIPADGAQFDVGPKTIALHQQVVGEFIEYHDTKVADGKGPAFAFHNGVFGKFEEDQFSQGTRQFMAQLKRMHDAGVQVYVGGGEGGAALTRYGDERWVTHSFTAGGTLLKALGVEPIPYIKALMLKCQRG